MKKLFTSIWSKFGLMILLLIIIFWLGIWAFHAYHLKMDRLNHIENSLLQFNNNLFKLENSQTEFLQILNTESNFFITGRNASIDTFNLVLIKQESILNNLLKIKLLNEKSSQIDSIIGKIKEYKILFENLVYTIRQRGNNSFGIIHNLQTLENNLLEANPIYDNSNTYLNATRISLLMNNYMVSRNPENISKITSLINEILFELSYFDYTVYPNIDETIKLLDEYSEIAHQLASIDQEIFNPKTGWIKKSSQSYISLLLSFSKLSHEFYQGKDKKIKQQRILLICCLTILTILICITVIRLGRTIKMLLHILLKLLGKLSKGLIPDSINSNNSITEFNQIFDQLSIIIKGLKNKLLFVKAIEAENVDSSLELLGKDDELGHTLQNIKENLEKTKAEQEKYTQETNTRRYINEGLAKFADILRQNNDNLTKLSDELVKELVKYLEAIQGGLFVVDDADPNWLQLTAIFAFNRKKFVEKRLMIGEGLVGACAKEKKVILLDKVPPDYIAITSGLGDTPPKYLLLTPMLVEEEILGVIEISSLDKFEDYKVEFVEEVAHSIASTITTTRINAKTAELLKKSQQQAAEMAEQEEEMRQNMEELKATQEESARREEEFEGILHSLNKSLLIIEYDLTGKIIKASDTYLLLLGKTIQNITGKDLHAFTKSEASKELDITFWNDIKEGQKKEIIEKIRVAGKDIWIKEVFSAVQNEDNEVYKYISVGIEITKEIENTIETK